MPKAGRKSSHRCFAQDVQKLSGLPHPEAALRPHPWGLWGGFGEALEGALGGPGGGKKWGGGAMDFRWIFHGFPTDFRCPFDKASIPVRFEIYRNPGR